MQYLVAHHLHVAWVTLSIALFILRGGLMLAGSPRLRSPVLRVLPHVVDTTLLASALWLVSVLRLPVFATPWLVAKLTGVVAYIVIGSIALRRGRSRPAAAAALVAALVTVGWVVSVAIRHDPMGFLAMLR
jgi:uncharacterized membrane protein SirB2